MSDDNSREPLLDMFLFETTQLIEQLEEIIMECETSKNLEIDTINEIFRIMHTIKGSSAMMMFNDVAALAHSLEDLFYYLRENKGAKFEFETLSSQVLSGIDFIKGEVSKIENEEVADGKSDSMIIEIKELLKIMKEEVKPKDQISEYKAETKEETNKFCSRIYFEKDCQMENVRAYTAVHNIKEIASELYYFPDDIMDNNETSEIIKNNGFLVCFETKSTEEEVEAIINQISFIRKIEIEKVDEYPFNIKETYEIKEKNIKFNNCNDEVQDFTQKIPEEEHVEKEEGNKARSENKQHSIISVNVSKLDLLMDLVGEIVISEAMVTRNPDLKGLKLENFNKAAIQLRKLTNELQDIVMSIRMVPISMVFQKMKRIVRDMSIKLSKDVDFEIIGEETEVDKNIIDHLSDPLMHLIRNSIDHGLEDKADRVNAGKAEKGKITLEARNAGRDVWIIIKDDGRGLNRDKILNKAREQGLVQKPESELTDKEIFSYILLPGFSTKDKVTEFSGRGVGMDVVKKNIETIGGNIAIESTEGIGTTILIKIPLTLAIIDGMEIAVGKSKYTIPITSIRGSFKAKNKDVIEDCDMNEIIMVRGECYPIIRIHKTFNIKTKVTKINDGIIIMVEAGSKSACLFVDELIGEQQVVVKALPKYIKKIDGLAGCTILGDGSISLIVDVNGII